jgi:hypothetical protein
MARTIQTRVFTLDELSDTAREAARNWFRDGGFDYDWWDAVYDDFCRICDLIGITLKTRPVPLMGGGMRRDPCIWFRGFGSQGDGAAFEGHYRYARGSVAKITAYAPKDQDLQEIAQRLAGIQRRNFYALQATIEARGSSHMRIAVEREDAVLTIGAEDDVTEALRDLAHWLHGRLEAEYAFLTSDEEVDEVLLANGYTFTEAGERFG